MVLELDMTMVSHFALDNSYLLRSIDLLDIIPGLEFPKNQSNPLDLLVTFKVIFGHQRKLRNCSL